MESGIHWRFFKYLTSCERAVRVLFPKVAALLWTFLYTLVSTEFLPAISSLHFILRQP